LQIAVLGCGYWGSKHVRVLQGLADVERVIAVDQDVDRLISLQKVLPGLTSRTRLEDALDEVDAVVVATPPRSHAPIAMRILEAGKHALVEKPLATSSAEARELVATAEARGLTLMVGHTFEHNPAVWKLRELVESGVVGDVLYVDSARLNLGLYQPDVNVIWDLAPHDISIFNFVLRSAPSSVHAWGSMHAHRSLEDVAYLRLSYSDLDVTAHVHVSWLDPCKVRRVTVVGSDRMVVYNDLATEERIRVFDKGLVARSEADAETQAPTSYRYGDISSPFVRFEEPLLIQDRGFVQAVCDGLGPVASPHPGVLVVDVLECAERSLREGRQVSLAEVQPQAPVEVG